MRICRSHSFGGCIVTITVITIWFHQIRSVAGEWPAVLLPSAVLIPSVGQYLAGIQIFVMKLVIAAQLLRIFGLDYVGKGILSEVSNGLDNPSFDTDEWSSYRLVKSMSSMTTATEVWLKER